MQVCSLQDRMLTCHDRFDAMSFHTVFFGQDYRFQSFTIITAAAWLHLLALRMWYGLSWKRYIEETAICYLFCRSFRLRTNLLCSVSLSCNLTLGYGSIQSSDWTHTPFRTRWCSANTTQEWQTSDTVSSRASTIAVASYSCGESRSEEVTSSFEKSITFL